jgi:hypothetical protein
MPDDSQGFTGTTRNRSQTRTKEPEMRISRPKLNYANVIATIALFVALGGAAVAAGLPKNSVGPRQLKPGAVTSKALKRGAVTAGKIAPQAVVAGKLGANAVLPGNLGNGIINTEKLGDSAVIASKIRNGAVTTNKLSNDSVTSGKLADGAVTTNRINNGAVTSAKLDNGSVTAVKLAPGTIGQLRSKVESGETLRGAFDVGSTASLAGDTIRGAVSFPVPLANPGAINIVLPNQTNAACPGVGSGQPLAVPGNACLYVLAAVNLDLAAPLIVENNTQFGFGLVAKAKEPGLFAAYGVWAVTAP